MKADDDTFLNIDGIVEDLFLTFVEQLPIWRVWGFIMALVQPNRDMSDRYYVPY